MYFTCPKCNEKKESENFCMDNTNTFPVISICNDCSDKFLIEKIDCVCSVCVRKLPSEYFQHYRTRIKKNGLRLRVNTNCRDCSKKESSIVRELKKDNPVPNYKTKCQQCDKIVYEKVEDIPDGINGTNGPWQLDHDHETGQFRGYLCKRCNTGTGLIGDNESYWRNAKNRKSN